MTHTKNYFYTNESFTEFIEKYLTELFTSQNTENKKEIKKGDIKENANKEDNIEKNKEISETNNKKNIIDTTKNKEESQDNERIISENIITRE